MKKIIFLILVLSTFAACFFYLNKSSPTSGENIAKKNGMDWWVYDIPGTNSKICGLCETNGDIIIPPNIVEIKEKGDYIYGRKLSAEKPVDWMSDDWKRAGWFVIDKKNHLALYWFKNENDMIKRIME